MKTYQIKQYLHKKYKFRTLNKTNLRDICFFLKIGENQEIYKTVPMKEYFENYKNTIFQNFIENIVSLIEKHLIYLEKNPSNVIRNGWHYNTLKTADGFRFFYPIPEYRFGKQRSLTKQIFELKEEIYERVIISCMSYPTCTGEHLSHFLAGTFNLMLSDVSMKQRLVKFQKKINQLNG